MGLTLRSQNRKRRKSKFLKRLLIGLAIVSVTALVVAIGLYRMNPNEVEEEIADTDEQEQDTDGEEEIDSESLEEEPNGENDEVDESTVDIRISAVGDIMVHGDQIESAYDSETDSYEFRSSFEEIEPYIQEADLAIANLETTLRGPEEPYSGYPIFNAPDEIIDALDFAGFDTVITANNHSLDTGEAGLNRTLDVINEKDLTPVGTYQDEPSSRVVYKEVGGIQIALLAYTEMVNQVGDFQYTDQELYPMINLMQEERMLSDIEEAQDNADIILAYMHWGEEYQSEPNELQISYANLLAGNGVDLILGSHPHVIQPTEIIENDEHEAFVAYSLGNFISNQRVETLGEERAPTEDGVIVNIDIQKDKETNETTIKGVDYIPTWVYREEIEEGRFEYSILPIQEHLDDPNLPEDIIERMQNSYDETNRRLNNES